MNVVLISNPTNQFHKADFPPPGIAYLGGTARRAGHKVLLIDGQRWNISKIVEDSCAASPDLIGITCWTIGRGLVWELCEELKKKLPQVMLVIGGPHATMHPEHILQKTHAQAVAIGEGEETFLELLTVLEKGEDFKSIPGLVVRGENNTPVFTTSRHSIENIDTIARPYYDGFQDFNFADYEGFPALPHPTASIITSRGCVFNCSYCASVRFWGRRWRFRTAENVLEEIRYLVEEKKVKSLYFWDDNFPVDKQRAITICQGIIDNGWSLQWACSSHVTMLNLEILTKMKKSGCRNIDFGVESGSDRILKRINKKQTRQDIIRAFDLTHEVGIAARAYLIVGNMGEDEESIDETIELISRIQPRSSIGAALLMLLPGTDVYKEAVEKGFIKEDFWLDSDAIAYNLMEHSLPELKKLRKRLMWGIAKSKKGIKPKITYLLKSVFYEFPILAIFRSFVPKKLR